MKRLILTIVFALSAMAVMASSVHYFTYSQATRVTHYLNSQNALMIYCGYENELETYVLLNDVWSERVNGTYYEIWVYGYDAYTGEEIFMPIDLDCIWLIRNTRMYNAAKYLRFRCDVVLPNIVWSVPVYNTFVRVSHPVVYTRTYHYDVHCYGWVPPVVHPVAPAHGVHPVAEVDVDCTAFRPEDRIARRFSLGCVTGEILRAAVGFRFRDTLTQLRAVRKPVNQDLADKGRRDLQTVAPEEILSEPHQSLTSRAAHAAASGLT